MRKAGVLTIGTEITCGEVVNTNAAWVSLRLEELAGTRVFTHLSVRDQADEILAALAGLGGLDPLIVTGGLGPTSDDLTRACVARFFGRELEFDEGVWRDLQELHRGRGLPVREAHKHQCWFASGSKRLKNPAGSALGFYLREGGRDVFVLPGPPRELEAMWRAEVAPRLARAPSAEKRRWVRWTCLGAPESEVAEAVEPVLLGRAAEVGYRAQVPYVKVKVFVDPVADAALIAGLETALAPWIVARGEEDLAVRLLGAWPAADLTLTDPVTGVTLARRLSEARAEKGPRLRFASFGAAAETDGISLRAESPDTFRADVRAAGRSFSFRKTLPFGLKLATERGAKSAAEWVLWETLRAL